jgi:hypothetical protein
MFRGFCVNIGGRADDRIPYWLEKFRADPYDMYVFLETMWEDGGWGNVCFDGYIAHHCVRPSALVRGPGRHSGGVTVLLRESSQYFGEGVHVRVHLEAATGILLVANDTYALTVAACYFSPANSNVYASGLVSDQYLQALFGHAHTARAAGHEFVSLGDYNIRTGTLQDDVDGVPMDAGPVAGLAGLPAGNVPAARASQDSRTCENALSLLLGLNSCGCVLLNGRAPGDPQGRATCYKNGGSSVVDYGVVSVGLFPSVQSFRVLDRDGELGSQDHAPLSITINLQRALQAAPEAGARCAKTLRPVAQMRKLFVDALQAREAELLLISAAVENGITSWGQAIPQLLDLIGECALSVAVAPAPRVPGSHAPWFNEACVDTRDEFRAAWVAWWHADTHPQQFDAAAVTLLRDAMLEARRDYHTAVRLAKRAHELRHLEQLIETYFSEHQRDFWKVLKGAASSKCAITDIQEWTDHFEGVMGAVPPVIQLDAGDAGILQSLHAACRRDPALFDVLNAEVTQDEVGEVLGSLPTGKAPDLQGLTCEVLRAPAMDPGVLAGAPPASSGDGPAYACPTFIACVTSILGKALGSGCQGGCDILQCSKVAPVPKPQAAQQPANRDCYRPIGVGSVIGRVLDRIIQRRMDNVVEREGIRAPSQCGFRGEHGCLDALFVMQHLMSRVHGNGAANGSRPHLWATLIDFRKAFDLVRRDLLIDRCRQVGVHGPFLDALVSLYDRVFVRVCVNGRLGSEIQTHRGTRQGSELSPLLFGLFMDLLHELIKLQVPGSGPVIGDLKVPELMYADDVTLLAWDHSTSQQLLDCLSLFCTLFDMTVNLDKTHVVVFRQQGDAGPTTPLLYRGQPLQFVESCRYLGVTLHATKGLGTASDELAAKGRKALYGLFPLLRLHHITQCDMRMRMFDIMIEPIISYGAHIWGPALCSKFLTNSYTTSHCAGDGVHFMFLRELYGAHRTASRDVLLRDTHRVSMPGRWLSLAASWWEKLASMPPSRLAHHTWLADIELMLSGSQNCWAYNLLEGLELIGFVQGGQWRPGSPGVTVETVSRLQITKKLVMEAVLQFQAMHWEAVADLGEDPRRGPSHSLHLRTHTMWVHALQGSVHTRANSPGFLKLCMGRWVLWTLARYRLGGHHLNGRLHSIPRGTPCALCGANSRFPLEWHTRMVGRCGGDSAEDLRHFMVECPAYDHIRDRFANVFAYESGATVEEWLQGVFDGDHQGQLARCVFEMDMLRRFLLGKGSTFGGTPRQQPHAYIPSLHYPDCLRVGAGMSPRARSALLWCTDVVVVLCAALAIAICFTSAVWALSWLGPRVCRW